jgi:small-conductance mechanosensitive channel
VDFGIKITLRFLVEPRRRRGIEEAIWEEILREFAAQPSIDFAYPTTRFYDHRTEGKPALRPPAD